MVRAMEENHQAVKKSLAHDTQELQKMSKLQASNEVDVQATVQKEKQEQLEAKCGYLTTFSALTDKMGEFAKTCKELQKEQKESNSALSGLNRAQKDLSTRVGGIDTRIGDMDTRIGHLNKDVCRIHKSQQEVSGQIDTLGGQMVSLMEWADNEEQLSAVRFSHLTESISKSRAEITCLSNTMNKSFACGK